MPHPLATALLAFGAIVCIVSPPLGIPAAGIGLLIEFARFYYFGAESTPNQSVLVRSGERPGGE